MELQWVAATSITDCRLAKRSAHLHAAGTGPQGAHRLAVAVHFSNETEVLL
jgi:hypothetical protein